MFEFMAFSKLLDGLPTWAIMIFTLFIILVIVLWILLPFAVFGVKEKLNQVIKELKKLNENKDS